jgi:hypothetical protein
MSSISTYKTGLEKGVGLIQETLQILSVYEKDMQRIELKKQLFENNILSKSSFIRVSDIVNTFFNRYVSNDINIALILKEISRNNSLYSFLEQLLFVYVSRSNRLFFDFITNVYWKKAKDNAFEIQKIDATNFIQNAISIGKINPVWSEIMRSKISTSLLTGLRDFSLISKQNKIQPFFISEYTAAFLVHELHSRKYTDNQIVSAEEWLLFGMNSSDVIKMLELLSNKDFFIMQNSGEIIRISWKYNSLNELINGIS